MITFTIREASLEDAAAASILVTELRYPTQAAEMRERLVGLLVDPTYSAFVADSDGALLGLAGCRVGRYFEKNGMYAQLSVGRVLLFGPAGSTRHDPAYVLALKFIF